MKILILRFSSIGDIVLTTPVMRCLKQAINDVEIHYCTKRRYQELIDANPYVDKGYYLDDRLATLVGQLRNEQYDLVIDLHNNLRTSIIKRLLGKRAFSVNKINTQKWLYVRFKINVMPSVHIVDRYMETIKWLGVANDGKGLDHFISEEEHVSLSQLPYTHRSAYVAYAIGGQHATKRLPVNRMIELCRKIGGPIVLLGDEHDRDAGEIIRDELGDALIYNACGLFTINQSASLVEQSQVVFCHDTGLMHIAAALKKPIVSIWGSTTPQLGMYPYKTPSLIIENATLPCRPCSKIGHDQCPLGHFKCMNDLSFNLDPAFIWETAKQSEF
ncbi:glycosyltransferase family 9 protein [Spirosoma pollinicola]|uniref:Glycosyl transferase n=1 Tax=Spirosoma pollinicola TaxID=2057025 RepID=A0A2K8Z3M5_9BACT|nr:glycosyltransferase family 9 protein [Spirosoma pollinicola]AUD04451.1 glycosyl transferase [Spirosoma pollinicola]